MESIIIEDLGVERASEVADVLLTSFEQTGRWPALTAKNAIEEVQESLADDRISRIAIETGSVVGWIGGQTSYAGRISGCQKDCSYNVVDFRCGSRPLLPRYAFVKHPLKEQLQ